MKPVSLKRIAESLDFLMDDWKSYLNKITGEIVEIQIEYLGIAEESEEDDDFSEYEDWEQDSIRDAFAILDNSNDFAELPDKEEVNEYNIMENFCYSLNNDKLRNKLCSVINGKGAFRRFKDTVIQHNIENHWYAYKHKALCKIAREWCDFHKIQYE
ncbi:MAG: UPF0158 family protein [Desulfitobacteriaceae bacterium]